MDAIALWIESLQDAYSLARGERLNELRGVYVRRFDDRGLHPYSTIWGAVMAVEGIEEWLDDEALTTTPHALRNAARADADEEFRAEIRAAA